MAFINGRGLGMTAIAFIAFRIVASSAAWWTTSEIPSFEHNLYWQQYRHPQKNQKRWVKALKEHSGSQVIEVMRDTRLDSTTLYLDGVLQFKTNAEHMFHEMMAHVPLFTLPQPPRDVLILGGGDGGVALRVLRHSSVRRVVQVEQDAGVINASRRFFPHLAKAFDDPRVQLLIEDAIGWATRTAMEGDFGNFDACIIDIFGDPLGNSWTIEFFVALRQLLRPGGVLMQNVESIDSSVRIDRLVALHQNASFEVIRPVLINSYDYVSPFVALMSSGPEHKCVNTRIIDESSVNMVKSAWYSPAIHRAALVAPAAMLERWPLFGLDTNDCVDTSS
eukprot:TRINITY_DN51222_c0_g1_i1.p1 TRINITY_DN51222_c0_g1~~TRINITY_DN51222_c0_g1_i1.p1  ORF type:complete len:334 (-),score=35.97 TRINITY_DN51222_c0_g1_i1:449-1450(-)